MVTYGGMSRFYGRGTSGRFQLDVAQIRVGFLEAEAAYDRVRRFRLERVASILGGETPIRLGPGPKAIFHALPLSPTEVWSRVVSMGEDEIGSRRLPPLAGTPGNWRYNLDGFVVHTVRDDLSIQTYVQLFRDGGIEAVSGGILVQDSRRGGFYGLGLEEALIRGLSAYQRFWGELGVAGPMAMGLILSGIKGWKVLAFPGFLGDREETFDREVAVLPEVLVQDVGAPTDQVLKPMLDRVWNAGGWAESPHYHDGRWVRPR